jgi:outer membrane protein
VDAQMRQNFSLLRRLAFAAALVATGGAALADTLTDRAASLLENGRAKEAYQLLLPEESARAGDPQFDYLLGLSALEAGEAERAVFALERVLALEPSHHRARTALARAHLALGERDAARREFRAAQRDAPDTGKTAIDRQLSAIAAAEARQITAYLEAGLGWDSNVNAATASSEIAIPALGGAVVPLDPNARERSDSFASVSAGASVAQRLAPEWVLIGGIAGSAKLDRKASDFDTSTLDANVGARWLQGKEAVTLGAQLQYFQLDYSSFRNVAGLVAQWQHSYSETRQATLFGQYSQLRYPAQHFRDADRMILGAAYGRVVALPYAPAAFVSGYFGSESERDSTAPHMGHAPWGVRAGAQANLGDGWAAFAGAAHEQRRYNGTDPVFLSTRKDRQSDLGGGVSYLLAPGKTLIGRLSHTRNESNLEIYRFKRTMLTVSARFDL